MFQLRKSNTPALQTWAESFPQTGHYLNGLPSIMIPLTSRYYQGLTFSRNDVISFPRGIYGFENHTGFLLIKDSDHAPFLSLQSLIGPELCFVTLPAHLANPRYSCELSNEERNLLKIGGSPEPARDLLYLLIVTLSRESSPTVNLLAPIAIHSDLRLGCQLIQNQRGYSPEHPLLAPGVAGC